MKRLTIKVVVLVVFAVAAFVIGLEVGHRKGYDTAWADCKFDAKQRLYLTDCKEFWDWYDSKTTIIRKRRSFFNECETIV